MQAIVTKYLPATNCRGSRIRATCDRGTIVVSYPDQARNAHRYAAEQLIAKFCEEDQKERGTHPAANPWNRPLIEGGLPNNRGSCFVFDETRAPFALLISTCEKLNEETDHPMKLHVRQVIESAKLALRVVEDQK